MAFFHIDILILARVVDVIIVSIHSIHFLLRCFSIADFTSHILSIFHNNSLFSGFHSNILSLDIFNNLVSILPNNFSL